MPLSGHLDSNWLYSTLHIPHSKLRAGVICGGTLVELGARARARVAKQCRVKGEKKNKKTNNIQTHFPTYTNEHA